MGSCQETPLRRRHPITFTAQSSSFPFCPMTPTPSRYSGRRGYSGDLGWSRRTHRLSGDTRAVGRDPSSNRPVVFHRVFTYFDRSTPYTKSPTFYFVCLVTVWACRPLVRSHSRKDRPKCKRSNNCSRLVTQTPVSEGH